MDEAYTAAGPDALALYTASKMRCGGCGAKVGASALARALQRLADWQQQQQQQQQQQLGGRDAGAVSQPSAGMQLLSGIGAADDAAVISPPPPGHVLVQTADFFRTFWGDPFLFGRIAANHALGVRAYGWRWVWHAAGTHVWM